MAITHASYAVPAAVLFTGNVVLERLLLFGLVSSEPCALAQGTVSS
jgi:hypothetical protein